jgi:RNA polymerase sigma factor (sigma-70 family)
MAFARRLGLSDQDADDAVQETILAVHRRFGENREPFDRTRGSFRVWLRAVAKNKVLDIQRRRARRVRREGAAQGNGIDQFADPRQMDEMFDNEWELSMLARALQRVAMQSDPKVYQAFELYALRNNKPAIVAKLLGVTRNAVYLSKVHILQRLRQAWRELDEQEG